MAFSQDSERKKHYFFWTYHQENVTTNGISLGLGSFEDSMNNYTNGLKIELVGRGIILPLIPHSPISDHEDRYDEIQYLAPESISERINGIIISGAGTGCDCKTNGIQIGLIGHLNRYLNGISIAFLGNIIDKSNGIQISAFNESFYMNGLQIGLTNYGYKTNGLQIGLVNKSRKFKGIQVGLWNINQKRKFPLINWNFRD